MKDESAGCVKCVCALLRPHAPSRCRRLAALSPAALLRGWLKILSGRVLSLARRTALKISMMRYFDQLFLGLLAVRSPFHTTSCPLPTCFLPA